MQTISLEQVRLLAPGSQEFISNIFGKGKKGTLSAIEHLSYIQSDTLPVLYNNKFIGRFDPRADRKSKTFYIKSFHYEDHFQPDENFNNLFASKLKQFAVFNGCENIVVS